MSFPMVFSVHLRKFWEDMTTSYHILSNFCFTVILTLHGLLHTSTDTYPFKDEAQTALFKYPLRTAQ
jgi:hypothetical protein